jgi:hypothetical protein
MQLYQEIRVLTRIVRNYTLSPFLLEVADNRLAKDLVPLMMDPVNLLFVHTSGV